MDCSSNRKPNLLSVKAYSAFSLPDDCWHCAELFGIQSYTGKTKQCLKNKVEPTLNQTTYTLNSKAYSALFLPGDCRHYAVLLGIQSYTGKPSNVIATYQNKLELSINQKTYTPISKAS